MRSNDFMHSVNLDWFKSSFCAAGECVEIAAHEDVVIMRNSSRPEEGYVYLSPAEFGSFVRAAKAGDFGLVR
jgi:hypothetical protein